MASSQVQYLVVETSGVTDPTGTIRALDQEFGKMFRVRLDTGVLLCLLFVSGTEGNRTNLAPPLFCSRDCGGRRRSLRRNHI